MNGPGRGAAVALTATVAIGSVLAAGACSNGSDGEEVGETTTSFVVETEGGSQAFAGDEDTGVFSFEGDAGSGTLSFDLDGDGIVAQGEGGAYELTPGTPSGWPEGFPEPPEAEVLGGSVVDADALRLLVTLYRTASSGAEVTAFYEQALVESAPLVDVRDDRPESYVASVSFEGGSTGFVTVNGRPDGTEVAVQIFTE